MTSCMIKSHPKGLTLVMDENVEFETLVLDICKLFAKSKEFFKKDELILSLEGRTLSPEETLVVVEAIELNSAIKISMLLEESELRDARTIGQLDRFFFENADTNMKIIKGNVKSGEIVTSDTGILVVGDVKKNGIVIAKGNVCVVGNLSGEVRAGEPDGKEAFIVAGKFLAKTATIGGVTKEINVKYRGFRTSKTQREPVVVKLLHGQFHAEPLSSGLVMQD